MIKASFVLLACLSIIAANTDDDEMVPTCERLSPNEIHFDLSRMGLTALRHGFMTGNSVTCINLAGNGITELETGAFDGLPGLKYLNLATNSIRFSDFMGMNFPALRALVVDNAFQDYNPYYSENILQKRLYTVSLPRLEKLSFRDYRNNVIRSFLSYISAPNLTHLNVGSNHFTEIILPENVMESLTHLNVDDNQVHMVAFSLPKLRYLSMNRNNIHNLCMRACDWNSLSVGDMPALEYLSLENNQITNIEENAFKNNTRLKSLNFNGNQLTSLPSNLFHNVTLQTLELARNQLNEIPDICGLEELERLNLNGNAIINIDEASFCNLTHLRSIDLRSNQLTSVSDGTFAHLPALKELDLSSNKLSLLAPNWIGSGISLTSLQLNGNSFSDLASMSLGTLTKIDSLSITDNPLSTIMVRDLMSLPPDAQIKVCNCPNNRGNPY